ncbi:MAG: hypothetical protein ACFB03_14870 [Paracoccaceae bacterium]
MASLDRAYGARGALIAVSMAAVAGAVHGTFAHAFDFVATKVLIGVAGSVVLIMAGVISARQSWASTIALGLTMGAVFFLGRWTCWALMEGGVPEAAVFLTTAPWMWPGFLEAAGISGYWIVEAVSMCVPAMIGCVTGHERAATA